MITQDDPKRIAQIALVALLIIGCIAVLLPFVGAVVKAVDREARVIRVEWDAGW